MTQDLIPDLSDPDVREMAERDHTPEERWTIMGGRPVSLEVRCDMCHQPWRCPTRRALDSLTATP